MTERNSSVKRPTGHTGWFGVDGSPTLFRQQKLFESTEEKGIWCVWAFFINCNSHLHQRDHSICWLVWLLGKHNSKSSKQSLRTRWLKFGEVLESRRTLTFEHRPIFYDCLASGIQEPFKGFFAWRRSELSVLFWLLSSLHVVIVLTMEFGLFFWIYNFLLAVLSEQKQELNSDAPLRSSKQREPLNTWSSVQRDLPHLEAGGLGVLALGCLSLRNSVWMMPSLSPCSHEVLR